MRIQTDTGMMPASRVFDRMRPRLIQSESSGESSRVVGSVQLAAQIDSGNVTGLNLPFWPRFINCWIHRSAGSENIMGFALKGTLSTDGFGFELSAVTDSSDYELVYECIA